MTRAREAWPRGGPAAAMRVAGLPARAVLLGLLALYRKLLSPLLGPRCRFHPSCSAYAEEAIRIHGSAKGLVLGTWRVLRCSPLTPGGLDPVPPPGTWRNREGGDPKAARGAAYDNDIHSGSGRA